MAPSNDPFVDFKGGHLRVRSQHKACGHLLPPLHEAPEAEFRMNVFEEMIGDAEVIPDLPHVRQHPSQEHVLYLPLLQVNFELSSQHLFWMILKEEPDPKSFSRVGIFRIEESDQIDSFRSLLENGRCQVDHEFAGETGVDENGKPFSIYEIV